MKFTQKQINIITTIEQLLNIDLEVSPINRKTIRVKMQDGKSSSESDFYLMISRVCKKHQLGRVEPNGRNYLAIII